MTRFSKALTIFVTFGSLTFLGAAFMIYAGGPNWEAEADSLTEYALEKSAGDKPQWSAKARIGERPVGSASPLLPKVMIDVMKDQDGRQRAEIQQLEVESATVTKKMDEIVLLRETDTTALRAREKELEDELTKLTKQTTELATESDKKGQQANRTREAVGRRRDEIYQLIHQLDELRTDTFQLDEQRNRLEDELIRLHGVLERLAARETRLKSAGAKDSYND